MRALLSLSLLALLASCQSTAKAKDHVWSVKAPPRVEAESKLRFTVETTTSMGSPERDVPYVWKVDWVGIDGSHHKGISYEEQSIRVKGSPGRAKLRILANDSAGELTEVASATIEVVGHAPAK
jgi:hypothetical protein